MGGGLTGTDALMLVYAGLAVGAFLLVTGLGQLLRRGESEAEARNRRMRMIARGATPAEVLDLLRAPQRSGAFARLPLVGAMPAMLRQAGVTMPPGRFALLAAGLGVVGLAVGVLIGRPLAAPALAVAAALLPFAVVARRAAARQAALGAQLPDALDLMARGLKVGHPLSVTVASVARDMPDPIGTEFGLIADQVSYGDDLVTAFRELAERVGVEDVHYLAASVAIQHGTGGDLARVLDVLSRVVRNRMAMRRRIHAISSEGRLSAWFLTALPVLIFGVTSMTSPDYYGGVAADPLFVPMMVAILVLVVLNALILRRLVTFRI